MVALTKLLLPKNTSVVISNSPIYLSRSSIVFKLFVRENLFYTMEKGLLDEFSQHGQVIEAKLVTDKFSERSKDFGFFTYASEDKAEKALQEINGKPLNGRVVFVDYAKSKTDSGVMPRAQGPPKPPVEQ
ncbi:small RNA-binding protein 11, chloroplastic-like [Capsicum annuum]|uniref:small RNA-binding protein 11, chloroplastic-like n=1 Tax=Capsicum annuum TaxID=4072 RepID=UPI001FB0F9D4|nr:small RNA-binding protein 11, chloroplastic-like [Capsicum annuum]